VIVFLKILTGTSAGKRIPISPRQFVSVGRTVRADLTLEDDPQVSSVHCEIENLGSSVVIRDMGSTNGTFLNGIAIREAQLRNDDVLRLGATELSIQFDYPVSGPKTSTVTQGIPGPPTGTAAESLPVTGSGYGHPSPPMAAPMQGVNPPILPVNSAPDSGIFNVRRGGENYPNPPADVRPKVEPGNVGQGNDQGGHGMPSVYGKPAARGPIMISIDGSVPSSEIPGGYVRPAVPDSDREPHFERLPGETLPPQPSPAAGSHPAPPQPDLSSRLPDAAETNKLPSKLGPFIESIEDSSLVFAPNRRRDDVPDRSGERITPLEERRVGDRRGDVMMDRGVSSGGDTSGGSWSPLSPEPESEPPASAAPKPPVETERMVVPDANRGAQSRHVIAALSPGLKRFQQTIQANGLSRFWTLATDQEPQPFAPTGLVDMFSATMAISVVLHFQKIGQITPAKLTQAIPLLDWLPDDAARQYGPVLLQYSEVRDAGELPMMDQLWGKDGCLVFLGADAQSLTAHLRGLIHRAIPGLNQEGGVFHFCWPSVLGQLLQGQPIETTQAIMGNSISAVLLEQPLQPNGWQLFGRPGFRDQLQGLGFQPMPPTV